MQIPYDLGLNMLAQLKKSDNNNLHLQCIQIALDVVRGVIHEII